MAAIRRISVLLVFLAACGIKETDTADSCSIWYSDSDGDGYGNPGISTQSCSPPNGYVADSTDCDDTNAAINPAAEEVCNEFEVDDDCNPETRADPTVFYADADGDGYGDPGRANVGCEVSKGFVADNTDCDDSDPNINPGEEETTYDGVDPDHVPVDDDCDGIAK